jgi:hypothetical protein
VAFVVRSATSPGGVPRIVVMRADGTGAKTLQVGSDVDWRRTR